MSKSATEISSKPGRIEPRDFRIGQPDNTGATVVRIYSQQVDFVVYRNDHSIKIDIDEKSSDLKELAQRHSFIAVPLGKIYSWLPEQLSSSEAINRQIGRSIAENAFGNHEHAIELLNHVMERIRNLKTMQGRLQYTLSSLAVVGIMLVLTVILSQFVYWAPSPLVELYYRFCKISFCGALGGLLSVSLGFPKLQIDIDADKLTNCLIGASRIFIAIAAAFFGYFAIESGIALSMFQATSTHGYGLYAMAMIAGFSEMLIPNLMSNLSATAAQGNRDGGDDSRSDQAARHAKLTSTQTTKSTEPSATVVPLQYPTALSDAESTPSGVQTPKAEDDP